METSAENTIVYYIYFDRDKEHVVMEWNGYANSNEFRTGTEKMLNELEQHKASKVLADIKNMVLIAQNDQAWLLDYFIPKAIERGFKQIAIVKPDHYFNQVALDTIAAQTGRYTLLMEFFDDRASAEEWLSDKT